MSVTLVGIFWGPRLIGKTKTKQNFVFLKQYTTTFKLVYIIILLSFYCHHKQVYAAVAKQSI